MATSDRDRAKGQAKPRTKRSAPGTVRGGESAKGDWGRSKACDPEVLAAQVKLNERYRQWLDDGDNEQAIRRAKSLGKVGMEAGNDSGQPSGESAKAEGGERAAGVFDGGADTVIGPISTQYSVSRSNYDRGVLRAAGLGTAQGAICVFAAGYASCADEQDWQAKVGANRRTYTALLIGITLGLLLSLAYQMVSRG
jgi:hypothetical protein